MALSDVLPYRAIRSVRVTLSTGHCRLFARGDCDRLYVCMGEAGQPPARGHGRPSGSSRQDAGAVWVEWASEIELTDRPAWLQPPLQST